MTIKPPSTHVKSRAQHPRYPPRTQVPDNKVAWDVEWGDYSPQEYTDKLVLDNDCTKNPKGWAQPTVPKRADISSLYGAVKFESSTSDMPLNPVGRTGMSGRGLLGRWGGNFAADPIVTRFNPDTNLLEMIAIKRSDTGEWAIPGGMVDPGEDVSLTLKREFGEEALASLEMTQKDLAEMRKLLSKLFKHGHCVYRGYVDDPRNTDNAWLETSAVVFHCSQRLAKKIKLKAGDDATAVRWLPLEENDDELAKLYASHRELVLAAAQHVRQKCASRGLFSRIFRAKK